MRIEETTIALKYCEYKNRNRYEHLEMKEPWEQINGGYLFSLIAKENLIQGHPEVVVSQFIIPTSGEFIYELGTFWGKKTYINFFENGKFEEFYVTRVEDIL